MGDGTKPFVIIGIPLSRSRKVDFYTSFWCWKQTAQGFAKEINAVPTFTPAFGRNRIVLEALDRPEITHVLFLDSDVIPPDDALVKLLKHDKDVVAGVTPMFLGDRLCWSAGTQEDGKSLMWLNHDELPDKLFKARIIGGTTMLIKRKVLEVLPWPYFQNMWKVEDNGKHRIMGEDVYFSNAIQQKGFELWVDPTIKCSHFSGCELLDVMKVASQIGGVRKQSKEDSGL